MTEETTNETQGGLQDAFNEFVEHQRRAFEETGKAIDALFPDGFKEHSNAARDEFRKGFKVLVDATIDELEKLTKADDSADADSDSDDPPSTTGRTKVKVQVE